MVSTISPPRRAARTKQSPRWPVAQPAEARADVALHAPVLEPVPVAGRNGPGEGLDQLRHASRIRPSGRPGVDCPAGRREAARPGVSRTMSGVRPPAVAGLFYPRDAGELRAEVEALVAAADAAARSGAEGAGRAARRLRLLRSGRGHRPSARSPRAASRACAGWCCSGPRTTSPSTAWRSPPRARLRDAARRGRRSTAAAPTRIARPAAGDAARRRRTSASTRSRSSCPSSRCVLGRLRAGAARGRRRRAPRRSRRCSRASGAAPRR